MQFGWIDAIGSTYLLPAEKTKVSAYPYPELGSGVRGERLGRSKCTRDGGLARPAHHHVLTGRRALADDEVHELAAHHDDLDDLLAIECVATLGSLRASCSSAASSASAGAVTRPRTLPMTWQTSSISSASR